MTPKSKTAKTTPQGAIRKSFQQGLSIRETAAATGMSRASVHRAKQQMLADKLADLSPAADTGYLGPLRRKAASALDALAKSVETSNAVSTPKAASKATPKAATKAATKAPSKGASERPMRYAAK